MAKTKGKRRFSPAQLAAQQRFKEMVQAKRAGAGRVLARIGSTRTRAGSSIGNQLGALPGTLIAGAIAAGFILAGKVSTRALPQFLNMDASTPGGAVLVGGTQLAAGALEAFLADMFLPGRGEQVFAGAVLGVGESAIKRTLSAMKSPAADKIAALFGDEGDVLMGYTYEVRELPRNVSPAMALAAGAYGVPMGLYPGNELGLYPMQ